MRTNLSLHFTPPRVLPKSALPRFGQVVIHSLNGAHIAQCLEREIAQHPQEPILSLNHYLSLLNSPAIQPIQKEESLKTVLTALFQPEPMSSQITLAKLAVANVLIPRVTQFQTYWDAVSQSSIAKVSMALSTPAIQYLNSLSDTHFKPTQLSSDSLYDSLMGVNNTAHPQTAWETLIRRLNNPYYKAQNKPLLPTLRSLLTQAEEAHEPATQQRLMQAASMLCTYISTKKEATGLLRHLNQTPHVKLDPHATAYLRSLSP